MKPYQNQPDPPATVGHVRRMVRGKQEGASA
jgi:hypothetical protein